MLNDLYISEGGSPLKPDAVMHMDVARVVARVVLCSCQSLGESRLETPVIYSSEIKHFHQLFYSNCLMTVRMFSRAL